MNIQITGEAVVDILQQADEAGVAYSFGVQGREDRRYLDFLLESEDWIGPRPRIRIKRVGGPGTGVLVDFFLDDSQEQ